VTATYEFLEHTADVGIGAAGDRLEEVFEAAAEGLAELLDARSEADGERRELLVEAPDRGALLVGWLDELLYLHETQGVAFAGFHVEEVSDDQVRASVAVAPAGDREREGVAIKAATFHDLEVRPLPDGSWRARVYLDV
jgi:SHS2 domain-containing protein